MISKWFWRFQIKNIAKIENKRDYFFNIVSRKVGTRPHKQTNWRHIHLNKISVQTNQPHSALNKQIVNNYKKKHNTNRKNYKMPFELNNNSNSSPEIYGGSSSYKRSRNESIVSVSSASSGHSDSSEDAEGLSRKSSSMQESLQSDAQIEKFDISRLRSMSDSATNKLLNQESFEVFPSLPDSVLHKMGLLDHASRELMSEEELEQKFVSLSLAFTIDATTIQDRCKRQRRYRDQTETNLNVEIAKLIQKANRIQPLCIDAETTELLSALLAQIEVVTNAATHATISSERYGAVQHENRLSESVNVMIHHVNLLKQQRDSARRQLQYTKRVLQNSHESNEASPPKAVIANGKLMTKRRASIATITQPVELKIGENPRKITRRTSDLSIRATPLIRNTRPSRLELGGDLSKIKEGLVETEHVPVQESQTDNESTRENDNFNPEDNVVNEEINPDINNSLRNRLFQSFRRFRKKTEIRYDKWTEDGTIHEICCFCALMCFSISLIFLANILIEVELAKRGLHQPNTLRYWSEQTSPKLFPNTNT